RGDAAEQLAGATVERADVAVAVDQQDAAVGAVEDRAQRRLGRPERLAVELDVAMERAGAAARDLAQRNARAERVRERPALRRDRARRVVDDRITRVARLLGARAPRVAAGPQDRCERNERQGAVDPVREIRPQIGPSSIASSSPGRRLPLRRTSAPAVSGAHEDTRNAGGDGTSARARCGGAMHEQPRPRTPQTPATMRWRSRARGAASGRRRRRQVSALAAHPVDRYEARVTSEHGLPLDRLEALFLDAG